MIMAVFALALSGHAQTVAISSEYVNQYVFRGQRVTNNVADASVAVSLPTHTSLSVLTYWDTKTNVVSVNRETELTLAQSFTVNKLTDVFVGATGYDYLKANTKLGQTKETYEGFAGAKFNVWGSPTVLAGYNHNLQQVFAIARAYHRIPVKHLKNVYVVPGAEIGYTAGRNLLPNKKGAAVRDTYYYGTGKLDAVYSSANADVGFGFRANYLDESLTYKRGWFDVFASLKF